MTKYRVYIALCLAISLFFRVLYLGIIPVAISHDEVDFIIQAHAWLQTGTDIVGTWNPLQLLPNNGLMGELSPLINAPALRLLPQSLFASRITSVILSVATLYLVWLWLTGLSVGRRVAIATVALLAVSPWHIIFSRTSLEQPTSLFFYLLSWAAITRMTHPKSNWKDMLIFTVSFTIGFYTYHGYKLVFPILTGMHLAWLCYTMGTKRGLKIIAIPVLVIAVLLIRIGIQQDHYRSRGGEIIFSQISEYSRAIDEERRVSIAPALVESIFSNKLVSLKAALVEKYIEAFSPKMLFLEGEANGVFSIWKVGYLYVIEGVFIVIGFAYLLQSRKPAQILLLTLLTVSPLASVIHRNNSYAFRSGVFFLLLHVIAAYGLIATWAYLQKGNAILRHAFVAVGSFLLICNVCYFAYIYFGVAPIVSAKSYFFGDRLVGRYVRLNPSKKIAILDPQPRYIFSNIILTKANISKEDILSFNKSYSPSDQDGYRTNTITVIKNCDDLQVGEYDTIIVDKDLMSHITSCPAIKAVLKNGRRNVSLVAPFDSGEEHRIFGDALCENIQLQSYVSPQSPKSLNLERMTADIFCHNWVVAQ